MRVFLGIVARADNGSSAEERARASALALSRANDLILRSFPSRVPPRAASWRSDDGAVVLASWDNEGDVSPRETLRRLGGGAITESGYATGTISDIELVSSPDLLGLSLHMGGCFAIGRANTDSVTTVTDSSNSVNLFTGESPRLRVVGSRALLAHLVLEADRTGIADPDPVYNGIAMRQMATQGHFFGGFTPFLGLTALPPATELRIDRWLSRRSTRPANSEAGSFSPLEARSLAQEVAGRLVDAFEPFRNTDLKIRLSGGRDSRLIASAAIAAGVSVTSATMGVPDHADVILAKQIAAEFGIEHRVTPPSGLAADTTMRAEGIRDRVTRVLDVHDGMTSAWDDIDDYGPMTTSYGVSGVGGEILRGGLILPDVDQLTPLIATTRIGNTMAGTALFTAELTASAKAFAGPLLELAGVEPHRAIDDYYYIHRNARWVAARRSGARFRTNSIDPLLDSRLIRAVRRVPAVRRWDERLAFDVINILAPGLRDLPPEGQRWRFERAAPLEHDKELSSTWAARAALSSPPGVRRLDWKQLTNPIVRDAMRDVIREHRTAMDNLFAPKQLDSFLARDEYPYPTLAWHLATVAIMLGTPWHRTQRPPKSLALELGPTTTR